MPNRQDHTARGAQQSRKLFRVIALDQLCHEVHIAAGTKRAARAGDDHDAHAWIAACFFESFGQITSHVTDERVEAFGPVQSDRDDAGVFGDFDEFFGHEKFRVSGFEFRV